MSLIKHRPRLQLFAPREVVAGSSVEVTLEVTAKHEVPVEFIDLLFEVVDRCSIPQGKHREQHRHAHVSRGARVLDARTLPPGTHRYPARLELDEHLPPTYRGLLASAEHLVTARVSIAWWPDRTESWSLFARSPRAFGIGEVPRTYSSNPEGPFGQEPHLECSVNDPCVVPGGVVEGQVALFNVAHNRYDSLALSLVAREHLSRPTGEPRHTGVAQRYTAQVPLSSPSEGGAIPFRLAIPAEAPMSFRSRLWWVDWLLVVRAKHGFMRHIEISVPLTMLAPGSSLEATDQKVPPTVGSERVFRIWDAVARELGMQLEGGSLRALAGDVKVTISRDHRGAQGIYLVAKILHPSVGLGLDGGLSTGFQRVASALGGDITFGASAWDDQHYIRGRESTQVRAYGVVLFDQLRRHRVADWDDEHIVLELRSAGTTRDPLFGFAESALAIARAIPMARDAIPPPACMAESVDEWHALARALDGTLDIGPMVVRGRIDGSQCAVITEWASGTLPIATTLEVTMDPPIEDKYALHVSAGQLEGDLGLLSTEARELVRALADGATALSITPSTAAVSLPAPLEAPAREAVSRLRRLARLSVLLRPQHGPYR